MSARFDMNDEAETTMAGIKQGKRFLAESLWIRLSGILFASGGPLEFDPGDERRNAVLEMWAAVADVLEAQGVEMDRPEAVQARWDARNAQMRGAAKIGAHPYFVPVTRRVKWLIPFATADQAYEYYACALSNNDDVAEAGEPFRFKAPLIDVPEDEKRRAGENVKDGADG